MDIPLISNKEEATVLCIFISICFVLFINMVSGQRDNPKVIKLKLFSAAASCVLSILAVCTFFRAVFIYNLVSTISCVQVDGIPNYPFLFRSFAFEYSPIS